MKTDSTKKKAPSLERGSGVLLHVSSLPSAYGIGDLGPEARRFVDFLNKSAQRYWQVLPLNPTDHIYGNSPYSSHSAFAMNVLFISPELLVRDGWLDKKDIGTVPPFPADRADYAGAETFKNGLFEKLWERWLAKRHRDDAFRDFCARNADWLDDYALFVVLKQAFSGQIWTDWPEAIRHRDAAALDEARRKHAPEVEKAKLLQFIVGDQWNSLKDTCRGKKVRLIGDIPIYVNLDSADVWANPGFFKLDENLQPVSVAGVPPDYFSATGQRWGNPVYDWDRLKEKRYGWWMKRLKQNLTLFDYLRIDHFRGLVGYWQIPVAEETAVNGQWVPGPGDDFFLQIKKVFSGLPIIAEDLGIITDDVRDLMKRFDIPGMRVLLFAFSGDLKTHPYIPDNYTENCVVYTGTHDNNTIRGWFQHDATEEEKNNLKTYLGREVKVEKLPWEMIRRLMESVAEIVLVPMQDMIGLGAEARMNVPATASGNWEWRLEKDQMTAGITKKLVTLVQKTGR